MNQTLRLQQDEAYEVSLRADREKERLRKLERERREAEDRQKRELELQEIRQKEVRCRGAEGVKLSLHVNVNYVVSAGN